MLVLDDISIRIAGRLLLDGASARIPKARASGSSAATASARPRCSAPSRARSALEHGAINMPARARIGRLAQEAPGGPERLIDVVLAADTERHAAARRSRDRARPASHRRDPDAARRHRRARGARARRLDPRRPRLRRRRAAAPLHGFLRRLAHARRARGGAVLRARPAAARRADQLSRSRRHAVADRSSRALSAHRDRHQPRPRPARRCGRLDPASRWRQARRSIAAATRRSRGSAPSGRRSTPSDAKKQEAERKHLQAFVDRFKAKATQGAPGAVARQAARQAEPDRAGRRGRGAADRDSRRPPSRSRRRSSRSSACRSATSRASRCCGG